LYTSIFSSIYRPPLILTLFPYTTLFRSRRPPVASRYEPALSSVSSSSRFDPKIQPSYPQQQQQRQKNVIRDQYPDDDIYYQQQRSEEHTSELQSRENLVCRLLLEKKQ